jgi:subtilase family serine protease
MLRRFGFACAVFATLSLGFAPQAGAQTASGSSPQALITRPIDRAQLVTLAGNTRPEANAQNDRGAVPDGFAMPHMMLQLKRSPAQEQALAELVEQLHDPASPNFHQWLTPAQIGARFGLAASDLQTIAGWLSGQGFQVNQVYPSGMLIDFSGTAGQVGGAFHTAIHYLDVNGASHFANMSDPQIPAALAPGVAGIVSLHDFKPRPQLVARTQYTIGGGEYPLVPADLATIYNFNPLFSGGTTGVGQTVVVVEDSDLFANSDWTTFRSAFGLSAYSGASLTTIHPAADGGSACPDPGVNSDDSEAILDAEYASAAAPSAAIVVAACTDLLAAVQNLVNGSNPPAIISMSYGECEVFNGSAENAAFNAAYQQGVAEGVSIFVASGDENAASCDTSQNNAATHGIGVNGLASTPNNVAVGGADFSDTYANSNSTYWNSTNTATYGSAKSYVPEIPWNDTCASQLIAKYSGYALPYGTSGFCNSRAGRSYLVNDGGSGGPSGCAAGAASIPGVVSGSCTGYGKPSWQSGVVGIPGDGVRDLPDVSLFTADGVWGHYFVFCWSDISNGGSSCAGAPSSWAGGGGTSFSTPIVAGLQALINQSTGQRQGNPNYTYYKLAAAEYGASGNSACNSTLGNFVASSCVFYDVTLGDIDAACTGTQNCYRPSGTYGVLSTSNSAYAPAYPAGTGWDFATGIGTLNAYNLVTNWQAVSPVSPLVAAVLPASRSALVNSTVTAFATIINSGGSAASSCGIAPSGGLPFNFLYQTTNSASNAVTGSPNTPVGIAPGASQSYVMALTPTTVFNPTNLAFSFACANTSAAPIEIGLNTLLLSASTTPVPDIVALAASSDPGIVDIPGASGIGVFAVATVNLGAASAITATANTGSAVLPVTLTLCQTNPQTGVCLATAAASASATINANATPTFGIFVTGSGSVSFSPAVNRVFVQFADPTGAVRGETSVAVRTQ